MPAKADFATWLNRRLNEASLDLTSLAAQAGISQTYLSMLRQGARTNPSRHVVEALAAALGAPAEEALKAAGHAVVRTRGAATVRTRGAPTLPARLDVPGAAPSEGSATAWSCAIEAGDVILYAEVQPVGVNQVHLRLRVAPVDQPGEAQQHEVVLAPGAKVAFTLRHGEREFHCQIGEGEEELVLRIPLSGRKAPRTSATRPPGT